MTRFLKHRSETKTGTSISKFHPKYKYQEAIL